MDNPSGSDKTSPDKASSDKGSDILRQARAASEQLILASHEQRQSALRHLIQGLKQSQTAILEENTLDLETSRDLAVSSVLLSWLRLTNERFEAAIQWLERVLALPDPLTSVGLTNGRQYTYALPVGVVAFFYEGLPTLALLAAALCLKTGNALIIRGGHETTHSGRAIATVLVEALQMAQLPLATIQMLAPDMSNTDTIGRRGGVDLVIPYGRSRFSQQILQDSVAPTMPGSLGNCYLFWDSSISPEQVHGIILASVKGCPDRVVAIEKVLIPSETNHSQVARLINLLIQEKYSVRGDDMLCEEFSELRLAEEGDWQTSFMGNVVAFRHSQSLTAAIAWINQYNSGPASAIVTNSYEQSRQFCQQVQTPQIFVNRPPQFSRHDTLALGLCRQRGIYGGLMDASKLLRYKSIHLA